MPINPDNVVIPSGEGPASTGLADIVRAVAGIEDPLTLRVVEALAHEKLKNLRLRSEHECCTAARNAASVQLGMTTSIL